MNKTPLMARGPRTIARSKLHPVHPARLRNDRHRQVSWLPDHCFLPVFPAKMASDMWDRLLPGHSCGGSVSIAPTSLFGPVTQTTYDVPPRYAYWSANARVRGFRNQLT